MSQQLPVSHGIFGLATLFGRVAITALLRALTFPFRTTRAPTFRNDVLFAVLRTVLQHITIPQARFLTQSTTQRYLGFCAQRAVQPHTLIVQRKDGAGEVAAHWIGNPYAQTVVLYLHGGGYTQPATEGYFLYFTRLVKDLNATMKKEVAVLVLAYQLSPEVIYPTQLQEAATMLSYLVNETGRSPSSIFLTGDSAGGGLSMSLLSHLLHPHPQVPLVELDGPLAGVVLYSPWLSFRTDYNSIHRNAQLDMIHPIMLRRWAAMYLGKSRVSDPEADPGQVIGDSYSEASSNLPVWWYGLNGVVANIFVYAGSNEVFVDSVREFVQSLRLGWAKGGGQPERITYMEGAHEAHIAPIMEIVSNGALKSDSQVAIEEWYMGLLVR